MTNSQTSNSVGVIISRFQTPDLTNAHQSLIREVLCRHTNVVIFIGMASMPSRRDPMDFQTRESMVRQFIAEWNCKTVTILPLPNMSSDHAWSESVDRQISEIYPMCSNVILYGGRDSFIPHYHGRFKTCDLSVEFPHRFGTDCVSATQVREEVSSSPVDSSDFRRGVIYARYNTWPQVIPCVDVVVVKNARPNETGRDRFDILLGRKPNEKLLRFAGGHVDIEDPSYELAALRELREECGANLEIDRSNLHYIGSYNVRDWRHAKNPEIAIKSSFYAVDFLWGYAKAGDDLEEVLWVHAGKAVPEKSVVPYHQQMLTDLLNWLDSYKPYTGLRPSDHPPPQFSDD